MTDLPIIFSGPMVRALQDGRKSQTRRVLNPQPRTAPIRELNGVWNDCGGFANCDNRGLIRTDVQPIRIPYAIGDRLWVKEAWRCKDTCDDVAPRDMHPEMPIKWEADDTLSDPNAMYSIARKIPVTYGRYRHALFMPRWASRLTLTVTDVRVQRLWDIGEEDARAEGVSARLPFLEDRATSPYPGIVGLPHVYGFAETWDSIHGLDAWGRNDWVVVPTFDVHRCNIDQMKGQ